MTAPHPDLAPPPTRPAEPSPGLKISLIQVIATALAAITATVVASFLGVAGTVVGAAVASTLSVVGTAVYSHSLRRTQERVRAVVPVRRLTAPYRPLPRNARPASAQDAWAQPTYYPARATVRPTQRPARRSIGALLAIGSAALFVAVLAVVTGVEAVADRPMSDLVRGENGSGTTLFGGSHSSQSSSSSASRPKTGRSASASHAPGRGASTVMRTVTRSAAPSRTASAPASSPTAPPPSASSSATPSPSAPAATGSTPAASNAVGSAGGGAATAAPGQ